MGFKEQTFQEVLHLHLTSLSIVESLSSTVCRTEFQPSLQLRKSLRIRITIPSLTHHIVSELKYGPNGILPSKFRSPEKDGLELINEEKGNETETGTFMPT